MGYHTMTLEEIILAEQQRIADSISEQYKNNKMSALDMQNRLKFLRDYTELTIRGVRGMFSMEKSL